MSVLKSLKSACRSALRCCGIDIVRYDVAHSSDLRRARILLEENVTLVVDVGANSGQYGQLLRRGGYVGKILSFEPLVSAYQSLQGKCQRDPAWESRNFALGAAVGSATIYVSQNSASSSLLPICQRTVECAPESGTVGSETVSVTTLDAQLAGLKESDRLFLKLDVQGFELQVLKGAPKSLDSTCALEVELSLVPLYEGQPLYLDVLAFLRPLGFELRSVETAFADSRTGQILQIDAILVRSRVST